MQHASEGSLPEGQRTRKGAGPSGRRRSLPLRLAPPVSALGLTLGQAMQGDRSVLLRLDRHFANHADGLRGSGKDARELRRIRAVAYERVYRPGIAELRLLLDNARSRLMTRPTPRATWLRFHQGKQALLDVESAIELVLAGARWRGDLRPAEAKVRAAYARFRRCMSAFADAADLRGPARVAAGHGPVGELFR